MPRTSPLFFFGLVVLLVLNFTVPAWLIGFDFASKEPSSFYSHQTDAFVSGQLHLKISPHPQLAKLSNPYLGNQNRNYRILDLSYYKGKYYSYFGVGAVVLLTLPWRLLVGNFLTEPGATVLLAWFSCVFSLVALWSIRKRYYPALSNTQFLAAYLLVTLGNYGTIHFIGTNAGTVAQYGAYLGLNAAIVFLTSRAGRWKLSAASFCCAFAVACRPSILPAAVILLPFLFVEWRTRNTQQTFVSILLATAVPFGAVVTGLLFYNYIRFDNPLEFGNRLQLTDYDYRSIRAFSGEHFYERIRLFMTAPFELQHYFPFFISRRDIAAIGLLYLCPASWAALGGLVALRRRGVDDLERTALFTGTLLAFSGVFLFLACYVVFLFHYEIDFLILWNWVVVLGWLSLLSSLRGWPKSVVSIGGTMTMTATAAIALLYTLSVTDYNVLCPRMAYAFNSIIARIDRLQGTSHGPITLEVLFTKDREGNFPLVATGHDHNDIVYAKVESGSIRFAYFHPEIGGLMGDPIPFDQAKPHRIELSLGSLLPPKHHPYFDRWSDLDILRAKTELSVTLDGKRALSGSVDYYPSDPKDVLIGQNPALPGIAAPQFAGTILSSSTRAWDKDHHSLRPEVRTGAVEVRFRLSPSPRSEGTEPILSTGAPGKGDLVFIKYLPDNIVQIGLDHWGQAFTSKPLELARDGEHRLIIRSAALADKSSAESSFEVYCDEKPILSLPVVTHPSAPTHVFYGYNAIRSTVSTSMFSGTITHVIPITVLKAGTDVTLPHRGGISLKTFLRSKIYGRGQPLVVCGKTGAADMVYLRLEDDHHLTLGFDHWGTGGAVSEKVKFDPLVAHRIDIALGGIRALDETYKGPKDQYVVSLDGVEVLKGSAPFYPVDLSHVYLGQNPVGASTADATFDGELMYLHDSSQ